MKNKKQLSKRIYRAIYNGFMLQIGQEVTSRHFSSKIERTEEEKKKIKEIFKKRFTLEWISENFNYLFNFRGLGESGLNELKDFLIEEGFEIKKKKEEIPKYYSK